jgi:hypothetical protein
MRRHALRVAAVAMALAISQLAAAEELHGVQATDKLGEIRAKFPNAVFTRVKAAWVTSEEDFFSMTGKGFPGTLYLAFTDSRPKARKRLSEEPETAEDDKSKQTMRALLQKWANESDDDALMVKWIRWVPPEPIPMQRYKAKYGEPTTCDFGISDMQPYCEWKSNALVASLSDDQKYVLRVESDFTKAELRAAWLRKAGFVPDHLKEETEDRLPEKRPKK